MKTLATPAPLIFVVNTLRMISRLRKIAKSRGRQMNAGEFFGTLDALLEFGFECFSEEFSSFDEKEFVEVIECLPIGGVIGDEIAVIEEGIKFGVKQLTPGREGRFGLHNGTSL
jgi:hypothetical protein